MKRYSGHYASLYLLIAMGQVRDVQGQLDGGEGLLVRRTGDTLSFLGLNLINSHSLDSV